MKKLSNVTALQFYRGIAGRVKDESFLSTNNNSMEVRSKFPFLKTDLPRRGKKCILFNVTFSFKYIS